MTLVVAACMKKPGPHPLAQAEMSHVVVTFESGITVGSMNVDGAAVVPPSCDPPAVVVAVIVNMQGRPMNVHVVRGCGMGLDEKAIEAVRNWRFDPAMKDGKPVAVQINVEVNFHLY